jgi:hemerythrin-like domain-containing protein
VIDVLSGATERHDFEGHRQDLVGLVTFIEKFMHIFHHGKEERFLFPSAGRSSPSLTLEIQNLISDHRRAKDLLDAMALELKTGGSKERYHQLSGEFVRHMTAHIKKEEDVIFPEIERELSPEEDRKLSRKFNDFTVHLFYKFAEEFADRIQDNLLGPSFYERMV